MSETLIEAALAARARAHAPYSDFLVGCAVESEDGQIAQGANMENICYRLGVCAEQSALAAAQIAFGLGKVRKIVVVGGLRSAGQADDGEPVMPCGGCRQAISEAAVLSGHDVEISCFDHNGNHGITTTIGTLLPAAFAFSKEG